ncbi:hypothetical protein J6590_042089 [Homalodisca vitripennis]|nr:hypothetical protein J6590_042089 [Homalodisca vitripennis]
MQRIFYTQECLQLGKECREWPTGGRDRLARDVATPVRQCQCELTKPTMTQWARVKGQGRNQGLFFGHKRGICISTRVAMSRRSIRVLQAIRYGSRDDHRPRRVRRADIDG